MRIAISGSHGVGKTTLARKLAQALNANYIHDIVNEEAIQKGFGNNEHTSPEVQLWLVCRQWELEQTTHEDWVADKCLFDYLVYGDIILKDEQMKRVIRKMVNQNAHYDMIFYLPIEFPMKLDGIRSENLDFQREVDSRYRHYLDDLSISYAVITGSVEKRMESAVENIRRLLRKSSQ